MRALVCRKTGELGGLTIAEVPEPTAASGEVKIVVRAAALNYADILMALGHYQEKPPLPFIPGMEVAGEVIEVAPGSRFRPGDRVMASLSHGGLAGVAVAREADVLAMPERLSFPAAAAFPLVYGTAHLGLTHRAGIRSGEVLVVTGAGGGVGLAAIEVGHALGAEVIAVTSGDRKAAAARMRGAHHVVDHRKDDVRARLKQLSAGRGQVFFDTVGGAAFENCLRSAGPEARILVVGFAGGDIQAIPANILLVKNVTVAGYYWGAYRSLAPDLVRASFEALAEWIDQGRIQPRAETTVSLSQAVEAMQAMKDARSLGKTVVVM